MGSVGSPGGLGKPCRNTFTCNFRPIRCRTSIPVSPPVARHYQLQQLNTELLRHGFTRRLLAAPRDDNSQSMKGSQHDLRQTSDCFCMALNPQSTSTITICGYLESARLLGEGWKDMAQCQAVPVGREWPQKAANSRIPEQAARRMWPDAWFSVYGTQGQPDTGDPVANAAYGSASQVDRQEA